MDWITQYNHVYGRPLGRANFRVDSKDFVVDEELGFEPSGEGEHHYLQIRKTDTNTQWLATQLASFAGVKAVDVSFSGLKDRYAVATQWFSVYLPKQPNLDWKAFFEQEPELIQLLNHTKHSKKLRRGTHRANRFELRLKAFNPSSEAELNLRLENIKTSGVPNYFGEQRFGIECQNLDKAQAWFGGNKPPHKKERTYVLSAARSYLFNLVLNERVQLNCWNTVLEGEASVDDGPAGPLWGRGRPLVADQAAKIEQAALEPVNAWLNGLEHCGLNQERRPLILMPENMHWLYSAQTCELALSFTLPSGAFATTVLREVAELTNCAAPKACP